MAKKSPYLQTERRLADVIAAIQATGAYKFYKMDFAGWADRITGDAGQAAHWQRVFEEHPEFFRLDSGRQRGSLVVRRQRRKLYSVDAEKVVTPAEARLLAADRLSRVPLSPSETETLVNVAIALHAAALERQRARRWWIPLIAAFLGALAGGLIARALPLDANSSNTLQPPPQLPSLQGAEPPSN